MTEQQEPAYSQAQDQSGTGKLKPDEIVERLIGDPAAPPDVRMLAGFLGKSPQPGYWRLYLTLELNEYVEFPGEDVVHSQSLTTEQNPLGGTIVWVKQDAKLQLTPAAPMRAQADFLKGDLTQRFLPEIGIEDLSNLAQMRVLTMNPSIVCTVTFTSAFVRCRSLG